MHIVSIPNGSDGYRSILNAVQHYGHWTSPRNMRTLDAGPVTIIMESPFNALPLGTHRNVSRRIAAAEALQLIGGFSMPKLLPASFDRFKEDDGTFWGAYGERIGTQLCDVARKLHTDSDTRQAIITLWNPNLDNVQPVKRDHPCTISFGFRIWHNTLQMNVLMRSSDAWLGIPYDLFQFTQLQCTLARILGIQPGTYTHTTWSLHLYEQYADRISEIATHSTSVDIQPRGIGTLSMRGNVENAHMFMKRARELAACPPVGTTFDENWYINALDE